MLARLVRQNIERSTVGIAAAAELPGTEPRSLGKTHLDPFRREARVGTLSFASTAYT